MRVLSLMLFSVILLASSSCEKCATCHLYQNGVVVASSADYCQNKKADVSKFKAKLESYNGLLELANAKIVCTDE